MRDDDQIAAIARAVTRFMQALAEMEDPYTFMDILDMAITASNPHKEGLYISAITSKCPVCGHEETIGLTELATPSEVIQVLVVARGECPECQQRARLANDSTDPFIEPTED